MKFTKEELKFLEVYVAGLDTKSEIHDKVQILADSKKGTVTFGQMSKNLFFITELKKDVKEDFELIVSVSQLNNLIKLSSDETVEIKEQGLYLSTGFYGLQNHVFSYSDLYYIKNIIETEEPKAVGTIKDLQKINCVRPYMGLNELATIVLGSNHFIGSNKWDATGIVKTNNDIDDTIYLTEKTAILVAQLELDSIDIEFFEKDDNKFYTFMIDNTTVIMNSMEYAIPNLMEDSIKKEFMHPEKVIVNKKEMMNLLTRFKIVASSNFEGRIHLTFDDSRILIESREATDSYAVEEIQAEIPDGINFPIVLSIHYLTMMISSLTGESLIFLVKKNPDEFKAIVITDENEDRFFVHTLYEQLKQ